MIIGQHSLVLRITGVPLFTLRLRHPYGLFKLVIWRHFAGFEENNIVTGLEKLKGRQCLCGVYSRASVFLARPSQISNNRQPSTLAASLTLGHASRVHRLECCTININYLDFSRYYDFRLEGFLGGLNFTIPLIIRDLD